VSDKELYARQRRQITTYSGSNVDDCGLNETRKLTAEDAEERARLKGQNKEQISELKSQIEDLGFEIEDFRFLFSVPLRPLCPLR
jgi:hypothetical protein